MEYPGHIFEYLVHKKKWEGLSSEEKKQVQYLSQSIWLQNPQVKDNLDDEILDNLKAKEIIIWSDGKWDIQNKGFLYFGFSMQLIESNEIQDLSTTEYLDILKSNLQGSSTYSFQELQDMQAYVLAHLLNIFKKESLLEVLLNEDIQNRIFWDFLHVFSKTIPILVLDEKKFCDLLVTIYIRIKNDAANAYIFQATYHLGVIQPEYAFVILDRLSLDIRDEAKLFIERIITGIANSSADNLKRIIETCESWLLNQSGKPCNSAIICLQNLVNSGKFDKDEFIEICSKNVNSNNESIRIAIVTSLTKIGILYTETESRCFDLICELLSNGSKDLIQLAISNVLSGNWNASDFAYRCLSLLVDVNIEHKGIINKISWSLYPIAKSNPTELWKFLETWINNHDLEASVIKYDMFLTPITEGFSTSNPIGIKNLSKWFISSNLNLVEEARSIIRELKINEFSSDEIKDLPIPIIKYMIEKLLVGGFDAEQLLWLCYSIINNADNFDDLYDVFFKALSYIAWNFPSGSIIVFDKIIQTCETNVTSLYKEVKREIKRYLRERKKINTLYAQELSSSDARRRDYIKYERKKMQKITQDTMNSDRFPLQKIIPRISIGRGSRYFHMNISEPDPSMQRSFADPSGFAHISETFELPRGEFIDPEGEAWLRFQRRIAEPTKFIK